MVLKSEKQLFHVQKVCSFSTLFEHVKNFYVGFLNIEK